tara:strand:+ start:263 stop:916 length:654 start_codon:yes stop_codon:yes gene_type:complete
MDIKQARKNVIEQQIRPWGGLNVRANQALSEIPREKFVPEDYQQLVFADIEIPLNAFDKMLSPKIEGRILDSLDLQGHENVLEVGTGSGYLTSVLAKLSRSVKSIEIEQKLYELAKENIKKLKLKNISLVNSDFVCSDFEEEQFDAILISSAFSSIEDNLKKLLKVGGKLFVVVGSKNQMHATLVSRKSKLDWQSTSLFETHLEFMKGHEPVKEFSF